MTRPIHRIAPMALWLMLVGGGLAYLVFVQPAREKPAPVAAKALRQNALVRGDVVQPGLTGRYIVKAGGVKAGERIMAEDLGAAPVPPSAPPLRLLLVLPLAESSLREVEVGSTLHVCDASVDSLAQVTVSYVHCGSDEAKCDATVEVPLASAAELASKGLQSVDTANALRVARSCKS